MTLQYISAKVLPGGIRYVRQDRITDDKTHIACVDKYMLREGPKPELCVLRWRSDFSWEQDIEALRALDLGHDGPAAHADEEDAAFWEGLVLYTREPGYRSSVMTRFPTPAALDQLLKDDVVALRFNTMRTDYQIDRVPEPRKRHREIAVLTDSAEPLRIAKLMKATRSIPLDMDELTTFLREQAVREYIREA